MSPKATTPNPPAEPKKRGRKPGQKVKRRTHDEMLADLEEQKQKILARKELAGKQKSPLGKTLYILLSNIQRLKKPEVVLTKRGENEGDQRVEIGRQAVPENVQKWAAEQEQMLRSFYKELPSEETPD